MKPHLLAALQEELTRTPTAPDYEHLTLRKTRRRPYRLPEMVAGVMSESVLSTPEGDLPINKIGKGAFAEVYHEQVPPGRVFAVVDEDVFDKDILAEVYRDNHENPHLPAVEKYGYTADKKVYSMPFYNTPLRSTNKQAWSDFSKLKKCNTQNPFNKYQNIECAEQKSVTPGVVDALRNLAQWSDNYSDRYRFEFAPRNAGTDNLERLVLLDPLFDTETLVRKRKERMK